MRTSTANPYCEVLGIQAPTLEAAKNSPASNSYSLLIVALLERGAPMTLEEAARRFEEARIAFAFRMRSRSFEDSPRLLFNNFSLLLTAFARYKTLVASPGIMNPSRIIRLPSRFEALL